MKRASFSSTLSAAGVEPHMISQRNTAAAVRMKA